MTAPDVAPQGRADMREILNHKVKLREWFRPLAPSMLEEYGKEIFGVEHHDPFMITVIQVAEEWKISREDQDAFGARSHQLAALAQKNGHFAEEISPVSIPQRKGEPVVVAEDEGVAAKVLVFIVLVASFDLLLGYTGIVSFAHTMFFGIGAYGAFESLFPGASQGGTASRYLVRSPSATLMGPTGDFIDTIVRVLNMMESTSLPT